MSLFPGWDPFHVGDDYEFLTSTTRSVFLSQYRSFDWPQRLLLLTIYIDSKDCRDGLNSPSQRSTIKSISIRTLHLMGPGTPFLPCRYIIFFLDSQRQ